MYFAVGARPNIAFGVSLLAEYTEQQTKAL